MSEIVITVHRKGQADIERRYRISQSDGVFRATRSGFAGQQPDITAGTEEDLLPLCQHDAANWEVEDLMKNSLKSWK